jgi:hypothetical protein
MRKENEKVHRQIGNGERARIIIGRVGWDPRESDESDVEGNVGHNSGFFRNRPYTWR